MNTWIKDYGKRLALAIFILAAGCAYSCGWRQESWQFSQVQGTQEDPEGVQAGEEGGAPGGHSGVPDSSGVDGLRPEPDAQREMPPCYVHVCGEVKRPGVYELKEGQRVYEAVHLAGGFTDQAAESYLNLAQPVEDGMKLEVPNRDQAPEPEWPKPGESPKTQAKVNLNKASKEELMALRGIGEAKAEDIIRYREEQGGFNCIEDIMNISGIKDAAFQKIKEEITV